MYPVAGKLTWVLDLQQDISYFPSNRMQLAVVSPAALPHSGRRGAKKSKPWRFRQGQLDVMRQAASTGLVDLMGIQRTELSLSGRAKALAMVANSSKETCQNKVVTGPRQRQAEAANFGYRSSARWLSKQIGCMGNWLHPW